MTLSKIPSMGEPVIDSGRCSGCGRCVAACGSGIYTLNPAGNRKVSTRVKPDICSLCGSCARECLLGAISLHPKEMETP